MGSIFTEVIKKRGDVFVVIIILTSVGGGVYRRLGLENTWGNVFLYYVFPGIVIYSVYEYFWRRRYKKKQDKQQQQQP